MRNLQANFLIKCDGARPHCQTCKAKGTQCEYNIEISPGQTRAAALKIKTDKLAKDNSALLEIFWYLQSKSAEEAADFLKELRMGATVESLVDSIKKRERGGVATSANVQDRAIRNERLMEIINRNAADSREHTPTSVPSSSSATSIPTVLPTEALQSANVSTIKTAANVFFLRTGILFYVFSRDQVDKALETLLGNNLNDDSLLTDVLKVSTDAQSKASICELCGMAAVGILYMRGNEASGTITPELASTFYSIAKHFLDNAIEADPLRSTKVCALLALYNIVLHATVALAYVGRSAFLLVNGERYTLLNPLLY